MWGDVSLSNTLFRRDAGAFAAYLVDAETGELHDQLTNGQREHDLEIARTNLYGGVQRSGGWRSARCSTRPTQARGIDRQSPTASVGELTGVEEFDTGEMHESRVVPPAERSGVRRRRAGHHHRLCRIELRRIQPKVVDAGHHQRRLIRLTGLDTEENQARRLLNDLDYYRARPTSRVPTRRSWRTEWLTEVFEPVVQAVPSELRAKLEPAEVYHEVLEHRWFLSEQSGVEVPIQKAAETYINTVLRRLPDEEVAMSALASMGPWPTRSTRLRASPTRSTRSRTTPGRTARGARRGRGGTAGRITSTLPLCGPGPKA